MPGAGTSWARTSNPLKRTTPQVGRALTEEQRAKLLEVAGSREEWAVTYHAALLSLSSTMRGGEIKNLRWRDVDLISRTVTVRRSKTEAGQRAIPLNDDAFCALMAMLERAKSLSDDTLDATSEQCYVFCACEHGNVDPTRPQKGWRTSWRRLTKAAGLPGLRFHDLRHSSITMLAESGLPDQVILGLAGHVSQRMLAHYSHIRMTAKRKAVEVLAGKRKSESGQAVKSGETRPAEESY